MATLAIPGFVDAHSHAFQRALRGRPGGERLLGLAGRHDRARRVARPSTGSGAATSTSTESSGRAATPPSGSSTTSGSRRHGRRRPRRPRRVSHFVCLFACYLRGGSPRFRQESVADYLTQLEALRADGIAVGVAPHSVRACPADALRRARRATPTPTRSRCTSMPTSSLARSKNASPSTACGRSPCSNARAVWASGRRSCTRRTQTEPSSICSPRPGRASASARRPRRISATASCRSPASSTAGSRCASAPTRTCASTRSRSSASSKGIGRRQTGRRGVISTERAARDRRIERRRLRSACRAGPTRSSTSSTGSSAASPRKASTTAFVFGCGGERAVEDGRPVARAVEIRTSPLPHRACRRRRRSPGSGTHRVGRPARPARSASPRATR